MLHCIAKSTWHIYNTGKTLYRGILLQLENKQQIMQNNVETQHKHMYLLYIGSLCNTGTCIALPVARITCIVASPGIHENLNAMKHSIEHCLLYGQRKHL